LKAAPADDRRLSFVGPNSYLQVAADGTKFRFRGNIDDARGLESARPAGRQLEKDELERLGRDFIKDALGEFVRVGQAESLTFLGVKYLREGSYDANGRGEEEVVANVAVFGREVDGVPVVGPGSKVAVWFANDRQPVGFDVDWPAYSAAGARQRVLPRDRLEARVRETTVPPDGTGRAEVARFECGYVDLGATRRASQLQAGCAIHYARRQEGGTLAARVEFVPAGETVYADPAWPLSGLVARGRVVKTDTAEYVRLVSKKRPPAADTSTERPGPGPRPRGRRRGRP
ncbi:MAG TPA: hypothetical protein VG148_17645, partial [Pyrinomonadaceae bacterium]|nr:hypothetical protein [Pyrinomonadaceae bacterium]